MALTPFSSADSSIPPIDRFLAAARHPERRLRVVLLVGHDDTDTAAVAHLLQSTLTEAGFGVGHYTLSSRSSQEQVAIDGRRLSDALFDKEEEALLSRLQTDRAAFPMDAARRVARLAVLIRERADLLLAECDADSADSAAALFPAPLCAVFMPFASTTESEQQLRHCGCLLKPGCAVISAPTQPPEILGTLMELTAMQGLTLHMSALSGADSHETADGLLLSRGNTTLLLPTHQRLRLESVLTALETLEALKRQGIFFEDDDLRRGMASALL